MGAFPYAPSLCIWDNRTVSKEKKTYLFKILEKSPEQIPMDRLGEYICAFASLIGKENSPTLDSIKVSSTGLASLIPDNRCEFVDKRIEEAANDPQSNPGLAALKLDKMLFEDGVTAELFDRQNNVIYLFKGQNDEAPNDIWVTQSGSIDGIVVGLQGADKTMHLQIKNLANKTQRFIVKDEELARQLILKFKNGAVRLYVYGKWIRGDDGWYPEPNKCVVNDFEILDDSSLTTIFEGLRAIPDNGWSKVNDPIALWEEIRGIH